MTGRRATTATRQWVTVEVSHDEGGVIALRPAGGDAGAIVHPPDVIDDGRAPMVWDSIRSRSPRTVEAIAKPRLRGSGPVAYASLSLTSLSRLGGVRLDWIVEFSTPTAVALELPVTLQDVPPLPGRLDLPGLYAGADVAGGGMYPRLDPRAGFGVRADRLPQVAALALAEPGSWAYFSADETPTPAVAGLVWAVCGSADEGGLRLAFRYPQAEWGHLSDRVGSAYVAKRTVAAGEDRRRRWRRGEHMRARLYLIRMAAAGTNDLGAVPRLLWRWRRLTWDGPDDPLDQVAARLHWVNRRLWNPDLEQYESPEGSGTALAGFAEMSLSMAVATIQHAALVTGDTRDFASAAKACQAIDTWLTDGVAPDGALLPVRDAHGFRFGRRLYGDEAGLRVSSEHVVEPLRLATEARALLSASRLVGSQGPRWRAAVQGAAMWLDLHRAGGVVPSLLDGNGAALSADPAPTAAFVALLADLAADHGDAAQATDLVAHARDAYDRTVAPGAARRRFGGQTLDASCPDREAAISALDASLAMFEATRERPFLEDARVAADVVLSYTFVYAIRTFDPGSDAVERSISTLGATLVSPENQQLDPFPVASQLIRLGLYSDDPVALRAGCASLAWCLDGRWAIREPDGIRQPEQFNHTRWHYNTFFTERGDLRRGMPCFGRLDSEHGWAQVAPIRAFLELGHLTLDWPSGRIACPPGCEAAVIERRPDAVTVRLANQRRTPLASPVLVRVLRPPRVAAIRLITDDGAQQVPWFRLLETLSVTHPVTTHLDLTITAAD